MMIFTSYVNCWTEWVQFNSNSQLGIVHGACEYMMNYEKFIVIDSLFDSNDEDI